MEAPVVDEIWGLIRRGELLGAYDLARETLEAGRTEPRLRYLRVLALARAGATSQAATEYWTLGLRHLKDEDSQSLWGRILKDVALDAAPGQRFGRLMRAARAYRRVHVRHGGYFPGVNSATLTHLGGRAQEARDLADVLLADPKVAEPTDYYSSATRGEVLALLGRWEEATAAFERARDLPGADAGSVASTRRQVSLLLAHAIPHSAVADRLLGVLHLPRVLHFTGGHIGPDCSEEALVSGIDAVLDIERPGSAVGSLWTDGAVCAAERLILRGVELHLVLPFGQTDFLGWFEAHGGPAEVERRRACLSAATTVTTATADGDFPDRQLVTYAEQIASGLAVSRARRLSTECVDLDIARAPKADRSEVDLDETAAAASSRGRRSYSVLRGLGSSTPPVRLAEAPDHREIRTFLFADVKGFTSIRESGLPAFFARMMGGVGEVIDAAGAEVLYRNTWGDALFLVIADVLPAADLALAIHDRTAELGRGVADAPVFRIGLHHGPVFRGTDPIRGVVNYFGTQVSRAARVEPIVPPGAVYVTEPFAALLAATGSRAFEAEYVGPTPLKKDYGVHRMYRLARRWGY